MKNPTIKFDSRHQAKLNDLSYVSIFKSIDEIINQFGCSTEEQIEEIDNQEILDKFLNAKLIFEKEGSVICVEVWELESYNPDSRTYDFFIPSKITPAQARYDFAINFFARFNFL